MTPKKIVLWGARGHAKVLRELITLIGFELVALFDNDPGVPAPFDGVPLHYGKQGFEHWLTNSSEPDIACLVAIGGARGVARLEIQRYMQSRKLRPAIAIHPTAFVAGDAVLGAGTQILAHSSLCANVTLGEACIVNTASSVDHECILGNGVHIAPGATVAGCVRIGDHSLVGLGANVLPRITIGANATVGAGSVVTRDVPDNTVVYGNPATVIREKSGEGSSDE